MSSAVAAACVGGSADAAILYSGVQNIERNLAANASSGSTEARIDLDFDGSDDVRILAQVSTSYGPKAYFLNILGGPTVEVFTDGSFFPAGRKIGAFAPGTPITGSGAARRAATFTYRSYNPPPTSFYGSEPDIAGFRFDGRLGWIRLTFGDGETPISLRVVDWAIESEPGVPIDAGAVPEPSSAVLTGLGLLALGARGVRVRRARRRVPQPNAKIGRMHG